MLVLDEKVCEILKAFDGANITAIDRSNCKNPEQFSEATAAHEGELWVSKDLCTFRASAKTPGMGKDITQVDYVNGKDKLRIYRVLDRPYFVWLYCSVLRAKNSPHVSDDLWRLMAQQFNLIWSIAIKWQGWEGIAKIKQDPFAFTDAGYEPPQPCPHTARRFNQRAK